MTTLYKAFNKSNNLVLTPEMQMFDDASNKTLNIIGALFMSKEDAERTASRVVSPKFKVVAVEV